MQVKYTGNSDVQEFSAADFKKANVDDQNKVSFPKGEAVEVSDAAGEALTSKEGIFGQHSFEQVEEDEATEEASLETEGTVSGEAEAVVEDQPAAEGKAAKTEGTADATTTTGTGRSTGRGSSTRSR